MRCTLAWFALSACSVTTTAPTGDTGTPTTTDTGTPPTDTGTPPTTTTTTATTVPVPKGVWSAAESLYGTFAVSSPPEAPALAVNGAGHAVALFLPTGDIRYADRRPGQDWTTGQPVRPNAAGYPAQVAVGLDDTTVVAWFTYASEFTPAKLVASVRAPGGGFGAAVDILANSAGYGALDVGVAADGTAVAVFGGAAGVAWSERAPGGAWSAPQTLSATAGAPVDLAVNDDGAMAAVWLSSGAVWAAYRPAGGAWEPAAEVAPGAWSATVTLDDAGDAVVGFLGAGDLWISERGAAGWGAPEDVSGSGAVGAASLAASGSGGLLAAWPVMDQGYHGTVWASVREAGGSFAAPVQLSAPYEPANAPSAAYAGDGTVAAVGWVDDGYTTARVATATPGAGVTWTTESLGHASWGGQVIVGAGGQTADAAWADQLASNPNAGQIVGAYWEAP